MGQTTNFVSFKFRGKVNAQSSSDKDVGIYLITMNCVHLSPIYADCTACIYSVTSFYKAVVTFLYYLTTYG